MNQFCKDVIEYLQSEYNDGYQFELIAHQGINGLRDTELRIKMGPQFTKIIEKTSMNYIHILYHKQKFNKERNQYTWQKELIDMIEGS